MTDNEGRNPDDWNRLAAYQSATELEQSLFWNRFTAFSALSAGLMAVFATETVPNSSVAGVLLSSIWVYVSARSRSDVVRLKTFYHRARWNVTLPFSMAEEDQWNSTNLADAKEKAVTRPSFNNLEAAVATAVGSLVFWIWASL